MTLPSSGFVTIPGFDPEEEVARLLVHLRTQVDGLDGREAARRLQQVGPNEIRRETGPPWWRSLLDQFIHPLALLLWFAAALSLATGVLTLAVAIVAVIVLNAAFAFAQERQAEHATEALRDLLPPHASVRRGGALAEIEATALVPGDLLLLAEGDRLSADARLIAGAVEVDMSPLTGESQPVTRSAERSQPAAAPLEAEDLVFAGTLCTGGDAQAVVYGTGMHTQLGRIAALSQTVVDESSPLQRQVNRAAQLIALVAVGLGVAFFAIGYLAAGLSLTDAGTFAIGLLVANVPEGLLPTITLALAVGVRRMAKRRALVKKLTAVETLGSTDVICTARGSPGGAVSASRSACAASRSSSSWPSDGALVVTARLKRGVFERAPEILREGPPFGLASTSSERHQVYLSRDELVFMFEGPHADEDVGGVLDDPGDLGRAGRLARHFKGSPSVPEEVFGWDRPREIDGVSFSAQAGPGNSDGG